MSVMQRLWTDTLLGKNPQCETGSSSMTQTRCTKLQSGLRGTTTHTFLSLIPQHLPQFSLGRQVHLADASSHSTAVHPVGSLTSSSQRATASSNHHASSSSRVFAEPSRLGTVRTVDKHVCKLVDTHQALAPVKEVPPV